MDELAIYSSNETPLTRYTTPTALTSADCDGEGEVVLEGDLVDDSDGEEVKEDETESVAEIEPLLEKVPHSPQTIGQQLVISC